MRELGRLGPGHYYAIWRNHYVDRSTGRPVIVERGRERGPIFRPRWHVCLANQHGDGILFTVENEKSRTFRQLDMRVVDAIQSDMAYQGRTREVDFDRMVNDEASKAEAAKQKTYLEEESDFVEGNERKLKEVMKEAHQKSPRNETTKRDEKIFS